MSNEKMASPQVVPRDSERAQLMREFFEPGDGSRVNMVADGREVPTVEGPMGAGDLRGVVVTSFNPTDDGWERILAEEAAEKSSAQKGPLPSLLAGMAVVRGMLAEQRGLGYPRAKELVLELLEARTASDELVRATEAKGYSPERRMQQIAVSQRLHALHDEVVGRLTHADRRARYLIRDRKAVEGALDELIQVARTPEEELAQAGEDNYLDFVRGGLVEDLCQSPDWQDRAMAAEDQLEAAEYSYASLAGQIREVLRLPRDARPSPADLRNHLDTLEGRVLAAEERRDQMAAFTVQMVDFLGRYRTNDMSSDMEQVHHALTCSPTSADTEKVARACLDAEVERRFSARTTEAAAREAALRAEVRSVRGIADDSLEQLGETATAVRIASGQVAVWRSRCYAAIGLAVVAVFGLIVGR